MNDETPSYTYMGQMLIITTISCMWWMMEAIQTLLEEKGFHQKIIFHEWEEKWILEASKSPRQLNFWKLVCSNFPPPSWPGEKIVFKCPNHPKACILLERFGTSFSIPHPSLERFKFLTPWAQLNAHGLPGEGDIKALNWIGHCMWTFPIKLLGLIIHRTCYSGANFFAVQCMFLYMFSICHITSIF